MRPLITMRDALADPNLLGGPDLLANPSWLAHRALLIATMGEALTDEERAAFKKLTERDREPLALAKELWVIAGRRAGKSRAIAVLAIYLGLLCDWKDNIARGERGRLVILAQNKDQAGVVFDYISGTIRESPSLAGMVANETAEIISLTNEIQIEVRSGNYRGIRGITTICVICDELAFWFLEGHSLNPDKEILIAARPALKTTKGLLVCIGSPYARRGEMWRAYDKDFGPEGNPKIIIAKGGTRDFNPTFLQEDVDQEMERDPASARAEYLGEFRLDTEVMSH